jgi:hypothetical protein
MKRWIVRAYRLQTDVYSVPAGSKELAVQMVLNAGFKFRVLKDTSDTPPTANDIKDVEQEESIF